MTEPFMMLVAVSTYWIVFGLTVRRAARLILGERK